MAGVDAIAVTSRAIVGLLEDGRPTEFDRARFRVFQAADMVEARDGFSEGVSLYLYRVSFNATRRYLPSRRDPITGFRRRPAVSLDLHFLLTAWAPDAGQQQRLLGWCVRTLEDTPILPAGFLNRFGPNRTDVFDASETVEIVGDNLSLQDIFNIWEVAKHRQQPSVSYVARQVTIDSSSELIEGPPVQIREADTGTWTTN
jgi:Pvc16 N-terminal domain